MKGVNPDTHKVGGEVDKVCIVFVNKLNHCGFEELVVELQVFTHFLQRHALPALRNEAIHVEVILCNICTIHT